jgi:hypothetical protein
VRRATCPPHSFQKVGDVYRPIIGIKRHPHTPTRYNRKHYTTENIRGPLTQRVFCSRCLTSGTVLAGDGRRE